MSWRDTVTGYLDKRKQQTQKAEVTEAAGAKETKPPADSHNDDNAKQQPSPRSLEASTPTEQPVAEKSTVSAASTSSATAMSRQSSFVRYKERLTSAIPVGQFDIENVTSLPLNISLNQVGPLYYDVVKPGSIFSRQTGKVFFTIEVRLHLGPASEYSNWSVAWPIMLVAGPSAAAISLAAIPIMMLMSGTVTITALVSAAVQGVSAAFSSVATGLGVANKLPFAAKYRNKAISGAKAQAAEAQKMAGSVIERIREKGGVQGVLDEWKARGGEPKLVEMPEQPLSVHDVTDVDFDKEGMAVLLDVKGPGPKTWKKKRWTKLKEDLQQVTLVDRGWYAGKEPSLRVVGGPRLVRVPSPFPASAKDETRTILEIYPLRLEKVILEGEVAAGASQPDVIVEELARGEGKPRDTSKVVEEAAEALRDA